MSCRIQIDPSSSFAYKYMVLFVKWTLALNIFFLQLYPSKYYSVKYCIVNRGIMISINLFLAWQTSNKDTNWRTVFISKSDLSRKKKKNGVSRAVTALDQLFSVSAAISCDLNNEEVSGVSWSGPLSRVRYGRPSLLRHDHIAREKPGSIGGAGRHAETHVMTSAACAVLPAGASRCFAHI